MTGSAVAAAVIAVPLLVAALAAPAGAAARSAAPSLDAIVVNRGVVELETAGSAGISVRIAEDLASVVNDGATRRVVPVVGKGSLGNLTDLKHLRGIDIAILQTDVLDYAREQKLPGIEASITYIAKLYNEEFHLLAHREINTVNDLANQTINVGSRDSGTAVTARRLFDTLKLAVTLTNDSQEVALEKLRKGDIAAMAFVAGKPAPLFRDLTGDGGLHFLAVPFNRALSAAYVPTRLTAADYPGLVPQDVPIDTMAVGAVLVAANLETISERNRNVANFVEAFFTGFPSLLDPGHHPKWQEVSLSAELPGWRRYPPAEQWLRRNMEVARAPSPEDLRAMFAHFVDEHRHSAGGAPMTDQEKDDLFQQYNRWQTSQSR
jgi:uncharacterized protein